VAAAILAALLLFAPRLAGTSGNLPEVFPCPLPQAQPAPADVELASLLTRASDYCDSLSQAALNFVCRERVDEWFLADSEGTSSSYGLVIVGNRKEEHRYVYDYQLVHDRGDRVRETRTLLEEDRKKVHVADAPLKTQVFRHVLVTMGPIGLLGRDAQASFDFRLARRENINGELAVAIEATPKPGLRPDYLFGTVWLRAKDAAVLKIQWTPGSMGNYEAVVKEAQSLRLKPDILMTSEYAFEKNGLRFPSRYEVNERYAGRHGGRLERSGTVVRYDQYKFFTVETNVKF